MKTNPTSNNLRQISDDPRAEETGLNQLFRDYLHLTQEVGHRKAAEAWMKGKQPSGAKNPGGGITVIPSAGEACNPLVLVFHSSWHGHRAHFGGNFERGEELETLCLHLVLCEKVKGVAIISEIWDSCQWAEHWEKLTEAWSSRGIVFGFAVPTARGRDLVPIPLNR